MFATNRNDEALHLKNIVMIKIELQLQVEFDPIVFCLPYLAFVPAPFFCVSLPSPHNFLLELFPDLETKVVYPKYSKHWLSTVAQTIDCVCSKILNHGYFFHFSGFLGEKTLWIHLNIQD